MKYAVDRLMDVKTVRLTTNTVVIIGLAWAVSLWINLHISTKLTEIPAYQPPKPDIKYEQQKKADYSVIKRRNIFNPEQAAVSPAVISPDDNTLMAAVPTALNLQLIGTVNTDSGDNSFAVILDKGTKKQNLLRINDEVAPGAVIVAISRLSVLINNAGRMESLSVEMKSGSGTRSGRTRPTTASSGSPHGGVWKVSEGRVIMDKRFLEKQLTRVNDLMTQVRAVPHMNKDKVMQGFKVFQIRRGSVFQKVGLKNHDVIQRINGQKLDSVEKGLDLFAALRDETHFTLDILRNNANKTINIEIQ
ncbi:MAG: type II secretion system protein GspC [Nitrospinota bacterium]